MSSEEKRLRQQVIDAATRYYDFQHKPVKRFKPGERVPYGGRVFDEREIQNLVDSSLDFWLTSGRYAEKFERDFAAYLGVKHCMLTNSGSSANLLAFMALTSPKLGDRRILPGDEVITVACGFPTTVTPIVQYGAVPVFVDVSLPTYNIDCSQLDAALSIKTKAIMIAHTLGNPFDVKAVKTFCDKHELWLIEDNCDALGSRYCLDGEWRYTGTFGHVGTSSFYPPHHMTMGEGGAVYTNDTTLKRLVESFRDWGRDCWCGPGNDNTCGDRFNRKFGELPLGYDHKYVFSHFGFNLKVTDMQAAVGCAQLEKLSGFTAERKKNWLQLNEGLAGLDDKFILPKPSPNSEPSWFGYVLTVRETAGFSRDDIVQFLEREGIQTRMLFAGNLIKHPCFDEMRKNGKGFKIIAGGTSLNTLAEDHLPDTNQIMRDSFWVGTYPGLTGEVLDYIVNQIKAFVERRG